MNIIHPFGPLIGQGILPTTEFELLRRDVYKTLTDDNKESHGEYLVGCIEEEYVFDTDRFEIHKVLFMDMVADYVQTIAHDQRAVVERFEMGVVKSWIVKQKSYEFNPVHNHGSTLSGIIYISVPDMHAIVEKPEHVQIGLTDKSGTLDFINNATRMDSEFENGIFSVKPENGFFYIFPGRLNHCVYPFISNDNRISLSFNAQVHFDLRTASPPKDSEQEVKV